MLQWLRRFIPRPEHVHGNRWLQWLGPRLMHRRLWRLSRRTVAIGGAVGVFFGLLIPVAQIPVAAGVAMVLRVNLPAAIGGTLVSNPITFAPIYLVAHRLGSKLLGEPPSEPPDLAGEIAQIPDTGDQQRWWMRAKEVLLSRGKPLLLGLSILAVSGAVMTYIVITLGWHLVVFVSRRRRRGATLGKLEYQHADQHRHDEDGSLGMPRPERDNGRPRAEAGESPARAERQASPHHEG